MANKKSIDVVLPIADPKGKVVKYITDDKTQAVTNVYISKAALKQLGDPDGVVITIKPIEG